MSVQLDPVSQTCHRKNGAKSQENHHRLLALPAELLEALLAHCDVPSLARLAQCSSECHRLVNEHGWPSYARRHLFSHAITDSQRFNGATWMRRVRESTAIDRSWETLSNVSHEDVTIFSGRTLPAIKLQDSAARLIVAGGSSLSTFSFPGHAAKPVEETYLRPTSHRDASGKLMSNWLGRSPTDDITAIACTPNSTDFFISHVSGLLQRCKIVDDSHRRPQVQSSARYAHPRRLIQAMDASSSGLLVTAASNKGGIISFYRSLSPWQEPYSWKTRTKPWSILLDSTSMAHPRWLALGHSSERPCSIYELGEDGKPVDIETPISLGGNSRTTAVYGFSTPPPGSSIGRGDSVIVSAWYDGCVRVHDLRRPSRDPVISLTDPFSDDPVYNVACGGGAGCTIAAGTARHGLVRLWDMRRTESDTRTGTSLFGPGKDSSPVYGLIMEHDRLFGATDRRTWMLSFGQQNDGHSGPRSFSKAAPLLHRSHMTASRSQGHRFSRTRIDTDRDDSQLAYYNHREMSLRRVT